MAKKKAVKEEAGYEYVRAIRDAEGNLRWEYKIKGGPPNRMAHDCDISDYSDKDIVDLSVSMLECKPSDVSVQYE